MTDTTTETTDDVTQLDPIQAGKDIDALIAELKSADASFMDHTETIHTELHAELNQLVTDAKTLDTDISHIEQEGADSLQKATDEFLAD